jgi:transcriptional regulator with XRE-family HTH domain
LAHPKRFSQSELSNVLGYKNGQFISNIERGLCSIPLKNLNQVIDILNIDREELMRAMMSDYESILDHYLASSKDVKPNSRLKTQRSGSSN